MRCLLPCLLIAGLVACKKEPEPLPRWASKALSGAARAIAGQPTRPTAPPTTPPAAGKGNIAGVVRYDAKGVPDNDVKLCQRFTSIGFSSCSGAVFTARTDADGNYVLRDVPPGTYQALLVRLFGTTTWVYASSDIFRARAYTIVAGRTIEASPTEVYKRDLLLLSPRPGRRVAGPTPTIRWAPYAGAAHYHVTLDPDEPLGAKRDPSRPRFARVKVDKPTFVPDKPLPPGRYRVLVTAMGTSAGNPKIAETGNQMFLVAAAADPEQPDPTPPPPYPAPPTFETFKPGPGVGAVQGVVLYNARGVPNIEVKLCETFNRYFGGCQGKVFKTVTDGSGVYLFKDVRPAVYGGLTARVFRTKMVVFMTAGFAGLGQQSYPVEAGKTLVVTPTTLFKDDVKILSPKKKEIVDPAFEARWAAYPGASSYTFSISIDYMSKDKPKATPYAYTSILVDKPSFTLDLPLESGGYTISVTALNAWGERLSQSHPVPFKVR